MTLETKGKCKYCNVVMSRSTQNPKQCTGGKHNRCRPGMDNKFVTPGTKGEAGTLGNAWCCQCARDIHAWHEYDRWVRSTKSVRLSLKTTEVASKHLRVSQVCMPALCEARQGPPTAPGPPDTCSTAEQKLEFPSNCRKKCSSWNRKRNLHAYSGCCGGTEQL